jgi:eukaryotic-like serine/threonine-protein kinase
MPWARAAPLLVQICGALQEAHELGIVHRDLKPENILITRTSSGRDYAKVLDFGLAKLDQRNAAKRETERQAIVGTPYFMAPEQIRGDEVDARTDIYSFGALMFELLTGEHLYNGSTAVGVLTKHLTADPDAPSMRARKMGIPPGVDHLCHKALAREPDGRWQTAAQLGEAIEEVYAETVEQGTGSGRRSAASRPLTRGGLVAHAEQVGDSDLRLRRSDIDAFERGIKRRRVFVVLATMLFVLGGAAAAVWWLLLREPGALSAEVEPNDEPQQANRIAPNTQVTGYLGKRHSKTEGDRDAFIVKWPAGSRRVVTVSVSGVPNMDISLSIVDGDGLHGSTIDEGGVGDGEILHRRAIDGPIIVTVAEVSPKDGKLPVENVSDAYTLSVTEEKAEHGETEPNSSDADANPIELNDELRGYLDTRHDVDLVRWAGNDGTYNVTVRADGLPLQWQAADGKHRTPGAAPNIALHRGDILRIERSDANGSGPLVGRDAMWSIVVTPQ